MWEDSPEGLVRHVLLLAVLLDGSLPPRERTELLLELHGNVVLRERAASYLGAGGGNGWGVGKELVRRARASSMRSSAWMGGGLGCGVGA